MTHSGARPRPELQLPVRYPGEWHLWEALFELAEGAGEGWTLVGGQMVLLHGLEHGRSPPRVSTDLDVLVNARVLPKATTSFSAVLVEAGSNRRG